MVSRMSFSLKNTLFRIRGHHECKKIYSKTITGHHEFKKKYSKALRSHHEYK